MKKLIILLITSMVVFYGSAQSFTLDTDKAVVNFNYVKEKVTGSITGIKATIVFDIADLSKSSISGSADVKTLTTGIKKRDEHLKTDDYFNAPKYPVMSFKSTSFESIENGYLMKGKMTIAGTEKEMNFRFNFTNGTFEGTGTIYMNDFNIAGKKDREDSKVLLKVTFPTVK
jgi:polyisoprenoid-binding protein YceI